MPRLFVIFSDSKRPPDRRTSPPAPAAGCLKRRATGREDVSTRAGDWSSLFFSWRVQVLEPVCLGGAWCSPRASDRCQVHRTGRLFAGRRPKAAAHRVAGGRLCSRTRVGLYFVLCSLNLCCLLCVCRRLPAGPALALRPSGPEACGSSSLGRGGTPANR